VRSDFILTINCAGSSGSPDEDRSAQIGALQTARRQRPLDALLATPELRLIESRANSVMMRVAWGSKVRIGAGVRARITEAWWLDETEISLSSPGRGDFG
jgi:hypothetical protein